MNFDFSLIEAASPPVFARVFLGSILTSVGPCNAVFNPLMVGYVSGSRDLPRARAFLLSPMFAMSRAFTFILLGVATALIGGLMSAPNTWWDYLVAFVCFIIRLNMLGLIGIETLLCLIAAKMIFDLVQ